MSRGLIPIARSGLVVNIICHDVHWKIVPDEVNMTLRVMRAPERMDRWEMTKIEIDVRVTRSWTVRVGIAARREAR